MNGQIAPERPWSGPLAFADIPETGRQIDLTAEEGTRAAVAVAAGIAGLPRLQGMFDVTRHGADGLHIVGRVSATVTQNCVVTLKPIESEIDEAVDLVFTPPADVDKADAEEPPEVLKDGVVDLGAIATEFLILGIDPYPRRPGAVFDAPTVGEPRSSPFAALAALKKDSNPEDP